MNRPKSLAALGISREVVAQRLRELAQLCRLGVKLRSARWIGPAGRVDTRPGDRFTAESNQGGPPTPRPRT